MGLLDFFQEATPEQKQQEIHDYKMRFGNQYHDEVMANRQAQQQQQAEAQWMRDNQDIMMGVRASAPRLSDQRQAILGDEDPNQPWSQELKNVPAQEATGFYAGEPSREFLEQRNQAMAASGVGSLMKQGQSNSGRVMDSVQSQINTIAGKRWDKNNVGKQRDMYQAADSYKYWTDTNERVNPNVIRKESAPLVQVGLGDEGGRVVTDEDKATLGLDKSVPYFWNKQGIPTPVKRTNYTEGHLQSAGYADRMQAAESSMSGLMELGYEPGQLYQDAAETNPLGNYILSEDDQVFSQAKHDWVRAKLRKESGAVIGDDEMAKEIATYFPKAGDKPAVIAAKARARNIALKGMARLSGGAFEMAMDNAEKDIKAAEKESKALNWSDM